MSRTRDVYCPRCDHNFPITKDEGDTAACPQCNCEFDVEWTADEDGESVRSVLPEMVYVPHAPPTGTVEAVMAAVEHAMFNQIGVPAYMLEKELPEKVDLRQSASFAEMMSTWDEMSKWRLAKWSILEQARYMDMKIVNNRKRMRKRVRQRRRHWSPPHWTEYPGDW